MGYAKYQEDISDRYWEDLAAIERLDAIFAPGTYQSAPPPEPTGWIRLRLDQGPLPDRIALVEGEQLTLHVETDKPDVPFKIDFTAGPCSELPEVLVSDRQIRFTLGQDGFYIVRVSCGTYFKDYEIDVSRTLDFDHQPPIQQGYLYLQDRPDEWTRERLDTLRRLMIPANRPAGVPDSFCNGILDYHLALFHAENENETVANRRFEDAYKNLRPFIAHSDVAHFICDYILYLMNRFDGCDASRSPGRFGGLRAFFRADFKQALNSCNEERVPGSGRFIEVLVKSVDQRMLDVVRKICHDSTNTLPSSLESLENRLLTGHHDAACSTRLHVVLARGLRRIQLMEQAMVHYQQVAQSENAKPWHSEANEFLTQRK